MSAMGYFRKKFSNWEYSTWSIQGVQRVAIAAQFPTIFPCLRVSATTSTSSCRTSSWEEARRTSDMETAVCPHGAASWWTARIAIASSPNAILEPADCSRRIIPEFTPGMSLATIGWSKTARRLVIGLYLPLVSETVTRYTLRTRSWSTTEVSEC